MEFLPVMIAIILGILVIGAIVLIVLKVKQSSGPMQAVTGRVIEKTTVNQGISRIVIQAMNGSRVSLLTYDVRHMICVGDQGVFEYQGETVKRFVPQR